MILVYVLILVAVALAIIYLLASIIDKFLEHRWTTLIKHISIALAWMILGGLVVYQIAKEAV